MVQYHVILPMRFHLYGPIIEFRSQTHNFCIHIGVRSKTNNTVKNVFWFISILTDLVRECPLLLNEKLYLFFKTHSGIS